MDLNSHLLKMVRAEKLSTSPATPPLRIVNNLFNPHKMLFGTFQAPETNGCKKHNVIHILLKNKIRVLGVTNEAIIVLTIKKNVLTLNSQLINP